MFIEIYQPLQKEISNSLYSLTKINFVPGTLSCLCATVGINFSQAPAEERNKLSGLATKVQEFALINSDEIPDMKAQTSSILDKKEGPAKRFALHHLTVLHSVFQIEFPENQCSYSTFALYWPSYIKKPNMSDFTSCHCESCENSSMKMDAIIKYKVVPSSMDIFAAIKQEEEGDSDVIEELFKAIEDARKGERKNEVVTYAVWEKVQKEVSEETQEFYVKNGVKRTAKKEPMKRLKSAKLSKLMEKTLDEFKALQKHLHRSRTVKIKIKCRRDEVLQDDSGRSVQIYVDLSEGLVLRQYRETQQAFFGKKGISLQTGYVYHRLRSFGFGSFAKGSDHKVIFFSIFLI